MSDVGIIPQDLGGAHIRFRRPNGDVLGGTLPTLHSRMRACPLEVMVVLEGPEMWGRARKKSRWRGMKSGWQGMGHSWTGLEREEIMAAGIGAIPYLA